MGTWKGIDKVFNQEMNNPLSIRNYSIDKLFNKRISSVSVTTREFVVDYSCKVAVRQVKNFLHTLGSTCTRTQRRLVVVVVHGSRSVVFFFVGDQGASAVLGRNDVSIRHRIYFIS